MRSASTAEATRQNIAEKTQNIFRAPFVQFLGGIEIGNPDT